MYRPKYFPCSQGKPLVKWSNVCNTYSKGIARAFRNATDIGENLLGAPYVIVDVDGNHGDTTDEVVLEHWNKWRERTECWVNPDDERSYHLVFKAEPYTVCTRHYKSLDILGNTWNQARYFKNKVSNNLEAIEFAEVSEDLEAYINKRKEKDV